MTQPEVSTFPSLPESILGPVLIGFKTTSRDADLIKEIWLTAASSVVITMPVLKVQISKNRLQGQKHRRKVLTGTSAVHSRVARLCDARGDEEASVSWERWHWITGLRVVPPDATPQFGGSGRRWVRLDVIGYRLRAGNVRQGQQLALFRHYVFAGFQAIDPTVVVLGGQHDWHDGWWPLAQETSTS